jgi:hypothetical protein
MSKKIEDYLHLYIGCQCQHCGEVDETKKLTGISFDDTQRVLWAYFENEENCYAPASEVKPILRRLSSMTEEEAIELYDFLYPSSTAERKIKRFAITNQPR